MTSHAFLLATAASPLPSDRDAPRQPGSGRAWKYLPLLSLLFTLPLPFVSTSRFGDLSNWYNDHLHHAYATWVFLHRGTMIYTAPFREAAAGIAYPHAFLGEWGDNPGMVYPPGAFAVFLPATLLGWLVPMSTQLFGAVNIAVLLLFAHAAFACFLASLEQQPPGSRLLVAIVVWLLLMRSALDGFFDVVWLGAAAAMQLSLVRKKPEQALVWFGLAAFVHFRAIVVAPLALAAFYMAVRGRPLRGWPWRSVATAFVLCTVSLASFFLMYPATKGMRDSHAAVGSQLHSPLFWALMVGGAALAYGTWRAGGVIAALTSACVSLVTLSEMTLYHGSWWHSSVCLAVLFLPGTLPRITAPSLLRQLGLIQLFAAEALLWGDPQGGAFGLLKQFTADYKF